jgi:hypothetical protein
MVVEGAINATFVAGTITMLVIGVLLHIVGLGIFCWALFALATYALPLFIGMTTGIYTYQTGAGPFGAIVVGFVTSDFILVAGQWAFFHRTLPHRPPYHWAAIRDSGRTRRVSCDPYPCTPWYSRGMVANVVALGAIAVGGTAWARVSMQISPALRPRASPALFGRRMRRRPVCVSVVSCLVYR